MLLDYSRPAFGAGIEWLHLAEQRPPDAYGWGEDWAAGRLDEEEVLSRLFRLNQERAAAEAGS